MTTHRSAPSATRLYGLYDSYGEGVTFHESREDRDAYAKKVIKEYLSEDEWHEEVTQVFAFVVTDRATAVNIIERKGELDDDGYDENDEYWPYHGVDYKCDYELKPFPAKTES